MTTIIDYDNFLLPATDLAEAKEFYQDKLGLAIKFDFSERGMIAFSVGGNGPAIILRKADNAKPAILFLVENVPEAYAELKEKGMEFLGEPFEIMTGLSVEFADPFGNRFALTDYSKRPDLKNK